MASAVKAEPLAADCYPAAQAGPLAVDPHPSTAEAKSLSPAQTAAEPTEGEAAAAAEELQQATCYVCEEPATDEMPLHAACACTDRLIHAACLQKMVEKVPSHQSGCCSVCKTQYPSAKILKHRERVLKSTTRFLIKLYLIFALVAVVGAGSLFLMANSEGMEPVGQVTLTVCAGIIVGIVIVGLVLLQRFFFHKT